MFRMQKIDECTDQFNDFCRQDDVKNEKNETDRYLFEISKKSSFGHLEENKNTKEVRFSFSCRFFSFECSIMNHNTNDEYTEYDGN